MSGMVKLADVWQHKPECSSSRCFCIDADDPDPVCTECGAPGCACQCHRVCPGCYAVDSACLPGCIDAEIEAEHRGAIERGGSSAVGRFASSRDDSHRRGLRHP